MTNTLYFRTYRSYGHFPYKIVDQVMRSILLVLTNRQVALKPPCMLDVGVEIGG